MDAQKLFRANALLPFSALELPWTSTDEQGNRVPLRLEDAPVESDQMIGFLPVFGNEDAAKNWSNGRFSVEPVELRTPTRAQPSRPAYATVPQPSEQPPSPDNTIKVNPNAQRGRRRGRK